MSYFHCCLLGWQEMQNVFRFALLCEESVFAANVLFAYVLKQDNVIHENTATISLGTMLPIFACGPLACFLLLLLLSCLQGYISMYHPTTICIGYFLVRVVAWGFGSSVRALNAERDRVCKVTRR